MSSDAAMETSSPEGQGEGTGTPTSGAPKRKRRKRGGGGGGSGGGARRGPPRSTRGMADMSPPRFDVGELAALSGPPLWQAVHPAVVDAVTDAAVFVEVRAAGHEPVRAAIPPDEFGGELPEQGAEINVRLLDPPRGTGGEAPVATASVNQANELRGLERVMRAANEGEPVPGVVIHEVKGGYAVALGAESPTDVDAPWVLRAFLPRSQSTHSRAAERTVVGASDAFDVTELEVERANIVVSRKARLAAEARRRAEELWSTIKEGDVLRARVRAIVAYGAFLDVGGVDGLMHMSDISWEHKAKVSDVLKVGQELDVVVVQADKEKKRLKLGRKQLTPDPWGQARANLKPGSEVEGDIVAIADFGAFVKLDDGVEGLVHTSEISWDRVKHPSHRFQIGQRVKAKVLDADFSNRRISLSTKALEANPYAVLAEKYPEGTKTKAKVRSLMEFGAFVEIEEGVEGLVHIGELSWTEHVGHPSEILTIGDEIDVVVMNVDVGRQRVSCSVKRLTENPWEKAEKKLQRGARMKAPVVRVVDRGAYFQIDEGITAFCPLRELTSEAAHRAQEVVKMGEEKEIEVKSFDRRTRKLTVSVRAVVEGDTKRAYDEYKRKEKQENVSERLTLGDALGNALKNLKAQVGEKRDDE